jgi:predicted nucleic acid-binding protein
MKGWVIVIPNLVLEEVRNNIDTLELRKALSCQPCSIDLKDLTDLRNRFPALANGELAVLFLTLNFKNFGIKTDESIAILDDKAARNIAKKLGINYFGTLRLLKFMLDAGILKKPQFYAFIQKLKESGFRFTDAVIRNVIG